MASITSDNCVMELIFSLQWKSFTEVLKLDRTIRRLS